MKPTILVVDDEPNIRQMLSMLLTLNGFAVDEAIDGLQALDKVHENMPSLMILDVMMPNLDGISVCKRLRADPETVHLPIIILSGKTHLNADVEGLAAGADYYMFKPMKIDELLDNINQALAVVH